jgi:trehalose synthase
VQVRLLEAEKDVMLDLVDVGDRSVASYRGVARDALLDDLERAAKDLRGARVLHVNATPYGGGVSELLRSIVPLLNDLGLVAHWRIISGDDAFFDVTKTIHNGMQGAARPLSDKQKATYLANTRTNAAAFAEEYDFVFMHDPQPAGILSMHGRRSARWIWRCHIDTASPELHTWDFLRPFLSEYDAAVFTMAEFVPPDMPIERVEIVPPAIDPRSPKNMPLPTETARQVLEWIGVRPGRPLVTQVSRFDPWKDPLGVIEAYRIAREEVPDLDLAMVGSLALDDPEGWRIYRQVRAEAKDDHQIHVFTNLVGIGNIEVNAFQALSSVVLQKSLREGFGLVVSEALWKGTPVVAGRTGGIPLQMADGVGGVLVDSVEDCARAIVSLLRDRAHARELGASGRERVRDHFLIPRLVLNELSLMRELTVSRPIARPTDWSRRDPVCGMALLDGTAPISTTLRAVTYGFCSEQCRRLFVEAPNQYIASSPSHPSATVALH